jgi:hypothetical protein
MWNINDIVELADKYNDDKNKLNLELNNYLIQELECNKSSLKNKYYILSTEGSRV